MTLRLIAASLALTAGMIGMNGRAHALTMQECSTKYKAAQKAGTLKGSKWNDFRKAECGADATAAPTAAPASTTTTAPKATTTTAAPKQQKKEAPPPAPSAAAPAPAPAPAAAGNAVFPLAVSTKYSTESPGKARMHTCLDQYNANKANNTNGGLRWIEKGGGYYSECNKRLKG
jgi:hypothetical protein